MAKPYTFKGDNSESCLLPSKKELTLKGKNLLQGEQVLSFSGRPHFKWGLVYKKSKHEVSKVVSLVKKEAWNTINTLLI